MLTERVRIYTAIAVARNPRMLDRVAQLVGGYSLSQVWGGWIGPEEELVEEPAGVLELIGSNNKALAEAVHIVEQYAWLHGETAVLTTFEKVASSTAYMEDGEERVVHNA